MPRSDIYIELDDPKDYFEILKGEKFMNSKVKISVEGNKLRVKINAQNPKALISSMGNIMKQIRIIDQTVDVIKK